MKSIQVPTGYPYGMTDKELKEKVKELSDGILDTYDESYSFAKRYSVLSQLGLAQLHKLENDRNGRFFKSMTKLTAFLSATAIICSLTSIYLFYKNSISNTLWQNKQMEYYEKINNNLLLFQSKLQQESKLIREEIVKTNAKIDSISKNQKLPHLKPNNNSI